MESHFSIEELFFSSTDLVGNIQHSNSVFTRVSGYKEEELSGAPHNIIRHPDMPKGVFWLLWKTIKEGKSIGAYVKNRAKNGDFYWVFACVFPVDSVYISIRLKPTSTHLPIVEKLYKDIQKDKKNLSSEDQVAYILKTIHSLGFDSYEDFMAKSLSLELSMRDERVGVLYHKNITETKVEDVLNDQVQSNYEMFARLKIIGGFEQTVQRRVKEISKYFYEIGDIPLNLYLKTARVADLSNSMRVISQSFEKIVTEIKIEFSKFQAQAEDVMKCIRMVQWKLGSARLQKEMLLYFVREAKEKSNMNNEDFVMRCELLSNMCNFYLSDAKSTLSKVQSLFLKFQTICEQIEGLVVSLEVIRLASLVESRGIPEIFADIQSYMQQITQFVQETREHIKKLMENSSRT